MMRGNAATSLCKRCTSADGQVDIKQTTPLTPSPASTLACIKICSACLALTTISTSTSALCAASATDPARIPPASTKSSSANEFKRSEERRVGKESLRKCSHRVHTYPQKKKTKK